MPRVMKYEALVSAKTPDEAVEVAMEALPRGRVLVRHEVEDVSESEGPGSYRVTLVFGASPDAQGAD